MSKSHRDSTAWEWPLSNSRTTLLAATIATGLMAGFFFAYQVSVTVGLADLDDASYVAAFQAINDNVRNPGFWLVWWGAIPLTAAAFWLNRKRVDPVRSLAGAGLGLYLLAVMITGTGNLPLNDDLNNLSSSSPQAFQEARDDFEGPWNNLNLIRMVAALGSFVCLAGGLAMSAKRDDADTEPKPGKPVQG